MGVFAVEIVIILSLALGQTEDGPAAIAFTVDFSPPLQEEFQEALPPLAETLNPDATAPATVAHLRRRADRDIERFGQLLRSQGYYGGRVSYTIEEDAAPVRLTFHVEPGAPYAFAELELDVAGEPLEVDVPGLAAFGLASGTQARSAPIVEAELQLRDWLRDRGYAFAEAGQREAIVDHATQTMDLLLRVNAGPRVYFGETHVEGLEHVKDIAVLRRLPWERGDLVTQGLLDEARRDLLTSELFSLATVVPVNEPDAAGEVPIRIEVAEREHRTAAIGLDFNSDIGLGIPLLWEHRNVGHVGRRFTADALISRDLNQLTLTYRRPFAGAKDRSFVASLEVVMEDSEAFESDRLVLKGLFEKKLNPTWKFNYGAGLRFSETEQGREKETYELLSLIFGWERDTSDDVLDPSAGSRLRFGVTPYADIGDFGSLFLQLETGYSTYYTLDDDKRWILALRTRLGSFLGADTGEIPPDLRFYAGGGGSVRGIPYRTASPLDRDDDPIGGKSVWEGSAEIRRRINETFGAVAFVDAGTAFESALPDFGTSPRIGIGVGLRVFTVVGPIRLDFAVPVSKRDGVDDSFQIYLSIGQAF